MDILYSYICHIKRQAEQLDSYESHRNDGLLRNFKPTVATAAILKSCDRCEHLYNRYQEPMLYNKSSCDMCETQKTQLAIMTKQFYDIKKQLEAIKTARSYDKQQVTSIQQLDEQNKKLQSQAATLSEQLKKVQTDRDELLEQRDVLLTKQADKYAMCQAKLEDQIKNLEEFIQEKDQILKLQQKRLNESNALNDDLRARIREQSGQLATCQQLLEQSKRSIQDCLQDQQQTDSYKLSAQKLASCCHRCLALLQQNSKLNYQLAQISNAVQNRFVQQQSSFRVISNEKQQAEQKINLIYDEIEKIVAYERPRRDPQATPQTRSFPNLEQTCNGQKVVDSAESESEQLPECTLDISQKVWGIKKQGVELLKSNSQFAEQVREKQQEIDKQNLNIKALTQKVSELEEIQNKFAATQRDLIELQKAYQEVKISLDKALSENAEQRSKIDSLNKELNARVYQHQQEISKLKQLNAFKNDTDEQSSSAPNFKVQPVMLNQDEDIFDKSLLPDPEQTIQQPGATQPRSVGAPQLEEDTEEDASENSRPDSLEQQLQQIQNDFDE